jgi:N-acetylneuraminic acid mutarotase
MIGSKKSALILILILCLILSTPSLVRANEDSWVTKESMQEARSGLGVAVVNGKIYAIGGSTESGFAPSVHGSDVIINEDIVGTNEEYDPSTDTWTFKTPMPTPRIVFATAVYQGKIYCIGGYIENNSTQGFVEEGYTGINEVYDPEADTWETKTSMPTDRGWLSANVVGDKIYVISKTVNEAYDPATDSWMTKTPSPQPATFASGCISAVLDNKIYYRRTFAKP